MNIAGVTKYVVYPSSDGSTRVQAVPVAPSSFTSRKSLPAIWCGVRDEELSALTNIEGCIFVHNNGFIGGAKTHAGALAMAVAALEL